MEENARFDRIGAVAILRVIGDLIFIAISQFYPSSGLRNVDLLFPHRFGNELVVRHLFGIVITGIAVLVGTQENKFLFEILVLGIFRVVLFGIIRRRGRACRSIYDVPVKAFGSAVIVGEIL